MCGKRFSNKTRKPKDNKKEQNKKYKYIKGE